MQITRENIHCQSIEIITLKEDSTFLSIWKKVMCFLSRLQEKVSSVKNLKFPQHSLRWPEYWAKYYRRSLAPYTLCFPRKAEVLRATLLSCRSLYGNTIITYFIWGRKTWNKTWWVRQSLTTGQIEILGNQVDLGQPLGLR